MIQNKTPNYSRMNVIRFYSHLGLSGNKLFTRTIITQRMKANYFSLMIWQKGIPIRMKMFKPIILNFKAHLSQ